MYQSTAKSEQFRERVGNESTKGSRKGFADGGEDPVKELTPEEQRASLVAVLRVLQAQVASAKATKRFALAREIGLQMATVQADISAIRTKRKSADPFEISQLFIDICREQMTKPQFAAIMHEANRRQRIHKGLEQPIRLSNGQT